MATIEYIIKAHFIEPFEVPDDVHRLPMRPLYTTRELIDWVDGTLIYHQEQVASRSASEHLEQFFIDFRCNPRIHADDLRRMMPTSRGIWSMHPPMLRVYGWVPRPHWFVAVCAELADDTKGNRPLNDECRDKVLAFIDRHNITEIVYGDIRDAFPN